MKKLRFLSIAVIALSCVGMMTMQSCTKLAKNLQYDLDLQTGSVQLVIPATTDISTAVSGSQVNYYNVDSFIKANTANVLGLSNITSAKIKSVTIVIDSPMNDSSNNFANFQSYNASVYSNSNTTPYTASVASNPDVFAQTFNVPVDSTADLKSYMSGTNFTYTLSGLLRRATTKPITCTVSFVFDIHVQG